MTAIIDYGMGNLASVYNALWKTGCTDALITSSPDDVRSCDRMVLPGVGAFEDAIKNLDRGGLISPILDGVAAGKPFLGLCLGFHLIFERGFENGAFQGLGLLKGDVVRFDIPLPVPHMGWNTVQFREKPGVFSALPDNAYFYFDHAYYPEVADESIAVGRTEYGISFVSAIARGNIFATQFHPEKSHASGLKIIESFSRMVKK